MNLLKFKDSDSEMAANFGQMIVQDTKPVI